MKTNDKKQSAVDKATEVLARILFDSEYAQKVKELLESGGIVRELSPIGNKKGPWCRFVRHHSGWMGMVIEKNLRLASVVYEDSPIDCLVSTLAEIIITTCRVIDNGVPRTVLSITGLSIVTDGNSGMYIGMPGEVLYVEQGGLRMSIPSLNYIDSTRIISALVSRSNI